MAQTVSHLGQLEAGHGGPGGAECPRCCCHCWCDDLCHHNLLVCKEAPAQERTPPKHMPKSSDSPCHELSLIFFFLSQSFTFYSLMICSDVYLDFYNPDVVAFIMFEPTSVTFCHRNKKSASLVTKVELKCKIMCQKLVYD